MFNKVDLAHLDSPSFKENPDNYKILPDLITLPLTLRQSLEITRDMWDWLSENPGKEKHQWIGFITNGGYVPRLQQECACCDFVDYNITRNCSNCPLSSLWGNEYQACCNLPSPFKVWYNNTYNTKAAKQIADAAREELRKLDLAEAGLGQIQGIDLAYGLAVEEKVASMKAKQLNDPYKPFKDAIAAGKTVQTRMKFNNGTYTQWNDVTTSLCYNMSPDCYRIKPEPKLRPWKPEEVPVGALLRDVKGLKSMITAVGSECFFFTRESYIDEREVKADHFFFSDALTYIHKLEHSLDHGKTWLPCGMMMEEQ